MLSDFSTPLLPNAPLGIFGAGGHGREIAWLARERWGEDVDLAFIVDNGVADVGKRNGIPVMPLAQFAARYPASQVVVAIGDPLLRERCAGKCAEAGLRFASLVHPRVEASARVVLGEGSIVCAGSMLTVDVTLGRHVHVNVACSISHDANVGDFTTLSPGVRLAGWVTLGQRVFLGTGAIVKSGASGRPIVIGDDAVIGAGACVIGDVAARTTVAGVPARPI